MPDLDVMVGQMVMAGFPGHELLHATPILADLAERHLGAIVLFESNVTDPAQIRALTATIQRAASDPVLIAIDQEGGKVNRLPEQRGFPPSVSAATLGALNDPATTNRYAERNASTLAASGINLNLAPDVDLNLNPANPIIGGRERSYSADPDVVTLHAREVIAAHHEHGILCAIKHFPGHGSSEGDTHLGFVDVTSTWREDELIPYERIVREGQCDAVMTAHVFHAGLDSSYPATLSRAIVTGILRERIGFHGVVISDDLQMRAISDRFGPETSVPLAVNAGVDMLSFANSRMYQPDLVGRVVSILRRCVDDGTIPARRIEESWERIRSLKARIAGSRQGKEVNTR